MDNRAIEDIPKACPIRIAGLLAGQKMLSEEECCCLREDCAWWVENEYEDRENEGDCSVRILAVSSLTDQ